MTFSNYIFPGAEGATFEELDDIQTRITQNTLEAYKKARSTSDAEEESEYLRRKGVLLPNGFTPLPPLYMEEGEALLRTAEDD